MENFEDNYNMDKVNHLAKQLLKLMPEANVIKTNVDNLTLIRCDNVMQTRAPIIYDPCIYIVVQGKKSALLGGDNFIYDALNYLVLSVPLPLECQLLEASSEKPYLAVKINIDTQILNELIEEFEDQPFEKGVEVKRGIYVSHLEQEIKSTLGRLLSYVNQGTSAKVLGRLAIKELLFHVLQGEQGELLKAFAYRDKQSFHIAKVIHYIQSHYAENIEVSELASKANMSQSSFHAYFKTVTSSSPIQYIKAIRLHAARRKMLYDSQSASDAAYQVGYASPSQFSREYRRFFGMPPKLDIQTNS